MAFRKVSYADKEHAQISTVEPIRKKSHFKAILNYFYDHGYEKYALCFKFGCYTGLRAGDILSFKVKDLYKKQRVYLREQKTGKVKSFPLQDKLRMEIDGFIERNNLTEEDYVFSGRSTNKEVDRSQVYRLINEACAELGIEDNVGTHTMRKTFGYHGYKQFNDPVVLQMIFNHTSQEVTKRYIGITQDEIDYVYLNINLEDEDVTDDEEYLLNLAVKGGNKKRNKRMVDFCKEYIRDTNGKGKHVPFAQQLLEIARYTEPYDYKRYNPKYKDILGLFFMVLTGINIIVWKLYGII